MLKCVPGDSLDADTYYTLIYNADTSVTGAAWSGFGSDATEVAAGDLYVRVDTKAATADKLTGKWPLTNPIYI